MTVTVADDAVLVDAVLHDRLERWAHDALDVAPSHVASHVTVDGALGETATLALQTCARIRAANSVERDRLAGLLRDADLRVDHTSVSDQRHTVVLEVDADLVEEAALVIERSGYRREQTWRGGAARSFRTFGREIVLTATGPHTSVVRLRWRTPTRARGIRGAMRRMLTPTAADWSLVDVPSALWWVYPIVRPIRLLGERVRVLSTDHSQLEPFLATPSELIEALFDLGDVSADDVVADVGCGDGRIIVAAASSRGCRALGIERSERLVGDARERVKSAGLDDLVRVVHGDVLDTAVGDVTVAVLFVPIVIARRVLPDLLQRLPDGARILLHEQSALPDDFPTPSSSSAVIGDEAVTVVHRWDVRSNVGAERAVLPT